MVAPFTMARKQDASHRLYSCIMRIQMREGPSLCNSV